MSYVISEKVDIKENFLSELDIDLLRILLKDQSTGRNLIWATTDYESLGDGYGSKETITVDLITGVNGEVIQPRINKSKENKLSRKREKAEVFTPSWVCNSQNNLIDNIWFKKENLFNKETEKGWLVNYKKILFPKSLGKTWEDYVFDTRLEVACGEAPYLTSRYDVVSGEFIDVDNRIGLLDRKLRIITENVKNKDSWLDWALIAVKNVYGYDLQGDNVLLARENILIAIDEYFEHVYKEKMPISVLKQFAEVISWNIWQMDGITSSIPKNFMKKEVFCNVMDWKNQKVIKFKSLMERA